MHEVEAKTILSSKNGINLYRGCTHGCIYCDSRSRCYRMDHDFEDVEVKSNSLELLGKTLLSRRRKCMVGTGSMTDPYIPLEKKLKMVRGAMELALEHGFGFTLITKSDLVLRDLDLLKKLNSKTKAVVQMTLTTADDNLCRILEPNVATTSRRVEVLKELKAAGIPTVVWLCPILPFINDTPRNIMDLVNMCREAGVYGIICFGMGMTLREGNREHFYKALDENFPGMKEKYIGHYGERYNLVSPRNDVLMRLFNAMCDDYGIVHNNDRLFSYLSELPDKGPVQKDLYSFRSRFLCH